MPKPKDSTIELLKERALHAAEAFARSAAKQPLPVRLAPIASDLAIKRVRFESLLSVAGLAEFAEGFESVINAEADGAEGKLPGTLATWAETDVDNLHPALRFTIAHEIAHVIVLKERGGNWRSDVFRKNQHAIEHTCNKMAAVLLMPASHVLNELGQRSFDAHHLAATAQKFRVSSEAFIRRLKQPDVQKAFTSSHGIVLYLSHHGGEFVQICTHVAGDFAQKRFGPLLNVSPSEQQSDEDEKRFLSAESLLKTFGISDIAAWLESSQDGQREIMIPYRIDEGSKVSCKLSFFRVHRNQPNIIFCAEILSPPQKD